MYKKELVYHITRKMIIKPKSYLKENNRHFLKNIHMMDN